MPITPHLPLGVNLFTNLISSVEAWLVTNVVGPYNSSVASTTYNKQLQIIVEYPDDQSLIAQVPAIVLYHPTITKPVLSTGNGDALVWNYVEVSMEVYPGLSTDPTSGALKPVLLSMYNLRALFQSLTTSLTIPLIDYTQNPPTGTIVDYAYITDARLIDPKGKLAILGLLKHRFDVSISCRFATGTLGGA